MKCRICGRDCPPGTKICRDCASARKRAFAQTVTQPLLAAVGAPSVSALRFAPKPLRPRTANDSKLERARIERSKLESEAPPSAESAPSLPLTVVPRKVSVVWLLLGVVVASAVVVLLLRTMADGTRAHDSVNDEVPDRARAPATPVAVVPAPPPIILDVPAAPAISEQTAVRVAPIKLRKAAPRVEAPSPAALAPAASPEPPPVVRAPTPAPRTIEAPRLDPWQALNEGLARCSREALFDRIGCEQKFRLQYCGNSWGLVPQCPIGPATDHGQ